MSEKKNTKTRGHGTQALLKSMSELDSYRKQGMTLDDIVRHYRRHHPARVHTVSFSDPGEHNPESVRKLRNSLNLSQAAFAKLVGVSAILVQGWERGVRTPSPLARRLLDIISRDPKTWLASLAPVVKSTGRRAG